MNPQTFNDGVVNIYSVSNISEAGNMPIDGLTIKVGPLRYLERTVGMQRYWTAMQEHVRIDNVLRVPINRSISTQDIAIPIDGQQYEIVQIQYPENIYPKVMDLSIRRLEATYDIA